MTRNAIYYKVKRVVPVIANSGEAVRVGFNMNGHVLHSSTTQNGTYLWIKRGTNAGVSLTAGDIPDLSSQYDQWRIAGTALKWYPGMPNGSVQAAYAPMAIVFDRDGIEGDIGTAGLPDLMEQTNGVTIKNAYRPWKKYIKTPKKRINTNVPSLSGVLASNGEYRPNNNIAGQWMPTALNVNTFTGFTDSNMTTTRPRGNHLVVMTEAPDFDETFEDVTIGTLVITTYLVYMDRK